MFFQEKKKTKCILFIGFMLVQKLCFASVSIEKYPNGLDSYTNNVKQIPMNENTELSSKFFSTNYDKIIFNHQYDSSLELINRLSLPDQSKIIFFMTKAQLDKVFLPNTQEEKQYSLLDIVNNQDLDLRGIVNISLFDLAMQKYIHDEFNKIFKLDLYSIKSNKIQVILRNNSDFNVYRIQGSLKVLTDDGSSYIYDLNKNLSLESKSDKIFSIYLKKNDPILKIKNLKFIFSLDNISFSNKISFSPNLFYKKIVRTQQLENF